MPEPVAPPPASPDATHLQPPALPLLQPWKLLPAYAINGIEVALGISVIHVLARLLLGEHVAPLVVSGAVCASIADLPNAVARTWHRVGAATLLAAATALLVDVLRPHPGALGAAVVAITFVAMMTLAWGPRAGAVSFAPLLALIFSMAVPPGAHPLHNAALAAGGSLAFLAWALLANAVLQRRYRSLALAQALRAAADLFRSRAAVLSASQPGVGDSAPMRAWISGEAVLAERLQAARDLLFAAPASPHSQRDAGILLRAIDLRDVLLASRLDAETLGSDAAGTAMLQRVATALRGIGDALVAAADHVRFGVVPAPDEDGDAARVHPAVDAAAHDPAHPPVHGPADGAANAPAQSATASAFAHVTLPPGDARARLLPSLDGRLQLLLADVQRIRRLLRGHVEALPLSPAQLQRFVGPEGWPLQALRPHWRLESAVLRHALRMSLALGAAYFLALALPWGSHPYWLILSVAVVLRGNLNDTLARRNARVLGTVLGCLVVVGLSHIPLPGLLSVLFIVALGVAHAFVLQRYWLTATAASVMALLQSHLVNPGSGFAIAERVADTFLGALIAWCCSYVLPSWERRSLQQLVARVLRDLQAYAVHALQPGSVDPVADRLARRQAYDALSALAAALQRSRVEPRAVRLPAGAVTTLLDHGERLMAHLSMVRLVRARVPGADDGHGGAGSGGAVSVPASNLAIDAASETGGDASAADTVPALPAATLMQARAAMLQAQTALCSCLEGSAPPRVAGSPVATRSAALDLLPDQPVSGNPLPWLLRRLELLVHEAQQVGSAAAEVRAAGAAMAGER